MFRFCLILLILAANYGQQISGRARLSGTVVPAAPTLPAFGSETQLTSDGVLYYGIATSGSTVHIARGSGTLQYRRSTDEGATFGSEANLGSGTASLDTPICASGSSDVHLFYIKLSTTVTDWCCSRDVGDVFMRTSSDNGVTWAAEVQVSTTGGKAYRIAVASAGSNVYCTWMDFRNANWDIFFRRSTDNGATFGAETRLVVGTSQIGSTVGAERPTIACVGSDVFISWTDGRDGAPACYTAPECTEIYVKHSTDSGATWGADTRLTNEPFWSARGTISVANGTVLVVWEQGNAAQGFNESWAIKSIDNGANWGTAVKLSDSATGSSHAAGDLVGPRAQLAWHDVGGNQEIMYRFSNNAGVKWSSILQLSNAAGSSGVAQVAQTTNYVHVIWSDDRTGASQIWYRRGLIP